jgi:aminoglycoside phosphotransferase (APT) family kinase protein
MALQLGDEIARGTRSRVYSWDHDTVAKVPLDSTPDEWIQFEADYTAAVHAIGAPVPEVRGLERINGRLVSIFQKVRGPSMWDLTLADPDAAAGFGRQLAELQCRLFELPPPMALPAQRDRLACKIRHAARWVEPSAAAALPLLEAAPLATRLCHGDLHPANVLMTADGPVVIDWFDASRGEPVGDVARTSLLLGATSRGQLLPAHLPSATLAMLAELAAAHAGRIRELRAVDEDEINRWLRIELAARLAEGVAGDEYAAVWQRVLAADTETAG